MAYVIAEPCIGTKDTLASMPVRWTASTRRRTRPVTATPEQLFIDPVECIDCGACVPVCPVSAIYAGDDLPEKWAEFTKNATASLRTVALSEFRVQARGLGAARFAFRGSCIGLAGRQMGILQG